MICTIDIGVLLYKCISTFAIDRRTARTFFYHKQFSFLNICFLELSEEFPTDLKNVFISAMVHGPSVFELLTFIFIIKNCVEDDQQEQQSRDIAYEWPEEAMTDNTSQTSHTQPAFFINLKRAAIGPSG